MKTTESIAGCSGVLVLKGAEAILAHAPLLEDLALRCGQPGAMHWLKHFFSVRSALEKVPYLVLVPQAHATLKQTHGAPLRVEDVRAAVVMFQYRFLGLSTRAFATDDISGFRTVIAPPKQRAAVAEFAARALFERDAQFVLVSYSDTVEGVRAPRLTGRYRLQWARRTRPVEKALRLAETFDATLATLGKATRFNLRYYRRRLLKKMSCEFVAEVGGLLRDSDLDALNAGSLNPIDPASFRQQYRSACNLVGGFVVGLRAADGKWLSLIGGWRQQDLTVLYWQMNAAGYEKDSIGTVMRSFFLEHEVERGARRLVIYGGTTHSMGNAFVRETVTDLIVRRRSWQAALLRVAAGAYCAVDRLTGRSNFLARAIARDELQWQPVVRRPGLVLPPDPTGAGASRRGTIPRLHIFRRPILRRQD